MTRRRRSALRRWWDRLAKGLRYWTEPSYARRSDGAKKAARTRRSNRGVVIHDTRVYGNAGAAQTRPGRNSETGS